LGGQPKLLAAGKWIAALLLSIMILFDSLVRLLPVTTAQHNTSLARA
jgi:hypothetical protein